MSSPWKLLDQKESQQTTTRFLVKYEFGPASYTVFLTDLTFLWTETLDRRQIVKRALNLETSIDPSEDAQQMQLLLRHVRGALEGLDHTAVNVHGKGDADKLTLAATIALPSPLPPLDWPIQCIKASQAEFTAEFVVPCLHSCSLAKLQVKSLLQHMKEKEHVLGKLTDKIQSDGTDLGSIFPGAPRGKAGSRLNAREIAAKSVRGLAEFEESQWQCQFAASSAVSSNIDDLLSSVFGSDATGTRDISLPRVGSLWSGRSGRDEDPSPHKEGKPRVPSPIQKPSKTKRYSESHVVNNTQMQKTPPSLDLDAIGGNMNDAKIISTRQSPIQEDKDSTTDESDADSAFNLSRKRAPANDLGLPLRPSEHSPPATSSLYTDRNIGKLESSTPQAARNSPAHESPNRIATLPPTMCSQSKQMNLDAKASNPLAGDMKKPVAMAKPKQRLGKIGGRTKADISATKDPESDKEHTSPASLPGHTLKEVDSGQDSDNQKLGQANESGVSATQHSQISPRKISEEQANENRKRLQRELESAAKTANKRKRRF